MIPIYVFGLYLGSCSCRANQIRRLAEVAYLRMRIKQQNYKEGILTVRP